jgi:hypothetical protein
MGWRLAVFKKGGNAWGDRGDDGSCHLFQNAKPKGATEGAKKPNCVNEARQGCMIPMGAGLLLGKSKSDMRRGARLGHLATSALHRKGPGGQERTQVQLPYCHLGGTAFMQVHGAPLTGVPTNGGDSLQR